MIISDVGVFMINDDGATLIELALDVSIEDARSRTEAEFDVAQHLK